MQIYTWKIHKKDIALKTFSTSVIGKVPLWSADEYLNKILREHS